MSHTPGPWIWKSSDLGGSLVGSNGNEIISPAVEASMGQVWDAAIHSENPADALLIAAAPDLLKAARLGLVISRHWIDGELEGTKHWEGACEELKIIEDAIEKAEGRG